MSIVVQRRDGAVITAADGADGDDAAVHGQGIGAVRAEVGVRAPPRYIEARPWRPDTGCGCHPSCIRSMCLRSGHQPVAGRVAIRPAHVARHRRWLLRGCSDVPQRGGFACGKPDVRRAARRPTRPLTKGTASTALSYLGDGIRTTAFPLLAVSLSASPVKVAAVPAAATLPWLIFGLHAGVLADRVSRRSLMVVLQLVRGLTGTIAVVGVVTGDLSILGLAVVAGVLGTCEVFCDIASHALLPQVVSVERLQVANSRLVAAEVAVSEFAGPALGGLLFALAVALPIGVDAATFLGSALLLASMRVAREPRPAGRRRERVSRRLAVGVRWFFQSPLIRTLTLLTTSINLGAGGLYAIIALFAREHLGLGPPGFGVFIAVSGAGSFVGGLLAARIASPGGRRVAVVSSAPLIGACFGLIALVPRLVVAEASMIAFGLVVSIFNVVGMSLRQSRTPPEILGRVIGVHRVICWGALPLGALGAGAVGEVAGLRWAVAACALAVVITWLASLPPFAALPAAECTVTENPNAT